MAALLSVRLMRCASVCEETLVSCLDKRDRAMARHLSPVMVAIAAIEQAAESRPDDPMHEVALTIAAMLCREAGEQIRSRAGLDSRLLRCAEACDRAVRLCETSSNPRPPL